MKKKKKNFEAVIINSFTKMTTVIFPVISICKRIQRIKCYIVIKTIHYISVAINF
jgi:hypothetical protein